MGVTVSKILLLYVDWIFLLNINQIDAHVGSVNDLAFSHPNKQLCIITCGDDKTIKVCLVEISRHCND